MSLHLYIVFPSPSIRRSLKFVFRNENEDIGHSGCCGDAVLSDLHGELQVHLLWPLETAGERYNALVHGGAFQDEVVTGSGLDALRRPRIHKLQPEVHVRRRVHASHRKDVNAARRNGQVRNERYVVERVAQRHFPAFRVVLFAVVWRSLAATAAFGKR